MTAEEIASRLGHLTLSQVYAALTYYHANQDEIDADIAAESAEGDRIELLYYSIRVARYPSRREFIKLPIEERRRILAEQTDGILSHYQADKEWQ